MAAAAAYDAATALGATSIARLQLTANSLSPPDGGKESGVEEAMAGSLSPIRRIYRTRSQTLLFTHQASTVTLRGDNSASCGMTASQTVRKRSRALRCRLHRADTDVAMVGRRCRAAGCEKAACYALSNSSTPAKPVFCAMHRHSTSVRVGKRCCVDGCQQAGHYGVPLGPPESLRKVYMPRTQTIGPEDLRNTSRLGEIEVRSGGALAECKLAHACMHAVTAAEVKVRRERFCHQHRGQDHVFLSGSFCRHEGCTTRASYGEGRGCGVRSRLFCRAHKAPTHVHCAQPARPSAPPMDRRRDGTSPRVLLCRHNGCKRHAYFADLPPREVAREGGCEKERRARASEAVTCARHRQEGQVDVRNKKCRHEGCSKQPTFGPAGAKPLTCRSFSETLALIL